MLHNKTFFLFRLHEHDELLDKADFEEHRKNYSQVMQKIQ